MTMTMTMTSAERTAFVREQIESEWMFNPNWRRERGEVIAAIVDRWETDLGDARAEARAEGQAKP